MLTPWTAGVGCCYALGALACALLTTSSLPWSAPMAWPAATLALLASGYFGLGGRVYGKRNGLHLWHARWLIAPDRWGHEISRRYYRRRSNTTWSVVAPEVWIGAWPDEEASRELVKAGVTAVLDLTAELPASSLARSPNVTRMFLNVLDLTVPSSGG